MIQNSERSSSKTPLILIVDDNDDNRYTMAQRLIRDGYENLVEASNGKEAMALLNNQSFDLVLLDVLMPDMDGFQVLELMKRDARLKNIPVIMVSAIDEIDSVIRCIEAGAEDYLQKPFNPVLLRARVGASLEKKRLRDETLQQLNIIRRVFGKYLPDSVVDSIVSSQGKLEPKLTEATILYSDIEDFTRIAESMPPQQVADMLNEYFEAVIAPVISAGGIVNQFQGDAMLVTFNVPLADKDHADKAIQVATEIQRITSTQLFAGISLKTRIGISSGTVFAGNIGAGERFNYTVHGDAVNLAARLERLNKDYNSTLLVSDHTVRLATGSYPFESIGPVTIRGKTSLVEIYRL